MWERNIDRLPLAHAPTGDWPCNPGMCPEQELNQQPFALQNDAQLSPTSQDMQGYFVLRKWSCLSFIVLFLFTYFPSTHIFFVVVVVFYWLCYYSCPDFSPLCPPPPSIPYLVRHLPTIVHVHGSCVYVLWLLHFLYCTLHPHGNSVTTYLYFLIPSPLDTSNIWTFSRYFSIDVFLTVSYIFKSFFICLIIFIVFTIWEALCVKDL